MNTVSAARGRPLKCSLPTPQICLQEFKIKERFVLDGFVYEGHNQTLTNWISILKITIKHSQTEMGLVFNCRF